MGCMDKNQEQCSKWGICYWKDDKALTLESSDEGYCMAYGEAQFLCSGKTRDRCNGVCHWVSKSAVLTATSGRCMAHGEAQFLCMHKTQEQCSKRGMCYWKDASVETVALKSSEEGYCKAHGEAQFLCMGKTKERCSGVCYWVPKVAPLKSSSGRCMAEGEAQFLCMDKTREECSKWGICYWKEASEEKVALETNLQEETWQRCVSDSDCQRSFNSDAYHCVRFHTPDYYGKFCVSDDASKMV